MGNTVPAMRATLPVASRSGAATNGPYRRGPIGRKLHYLGHILIELFVRHLAKRLLSSPGAAKVLTRLPHMPTRFVPWLASPATAWTEQIGEPPQELRTVAGIQRDPAAEADAYDKTPLHYFFRLHADSIPCARTGPDTTGLRHEPCIDRRHGHDAGAALSRCRSRARRRPMLRGTASQHQSTTRYIGLSRPPATSSAKTPRPITMPVPPAFITVPIRP
jgi:hypothetical protein